MQRATLTKPVMAAYLVTFNLVLYSYVKSIERINAAKTANNPAEDNPQNNEKKEN